MDPFEKSRKFKALSGWVPEESSKMFPSRFIDNIVCDEIVCFNKIKPLDKFKNKKVLIVGGGPSSLDFDFNNHPYDSIWSCNHFFLHDILKDTKIDLISVTGEVDLSLKEFLDYRHRFNPLITFEIHSKWYNYSFDDYENYTFFHTEFYSKLGICPRQIIFACCLGVKEIGFVGLDGIKFIKKGQHAFQSGKKTMPLSFDEDVCSTQYDVFWTYIKDKFPNVKFKNLGFGREYHKC